MTTAVDLVNDRFSDLTLNFASLPDNREKGSQVIFPDWRPEVDPLCAGTLTRGMERADARRFLRHSREDRQAEQGGQQNTADGLPASQ